MANKTIGKTTRAVSSWWKERRKILASTTKPKPARAKAKIKNAKVRKVTKVKKAKKTKKAVKKTTKTKKATKAKKSKKR